MNMLTHNIYMVKIPVLLCNEEWRAKFSRNKNEIHKRNANNKWELRGGGDGGENQFKLQLNLISDHRMACTCTQIYRLGAKCSERKKCFMISMRVTHSAAIENVKKEAHTKLTLKWMNLWWFCFRVASVLSLFPLSFFSLSLRRVAGERAYYCCPFAHDN